MTTVALLSGGPVAATSPSIVAGHHDAPIQVPEGTPTAVASLPVGAGNWYATATFLVVGVSDAGRATCVLSAGGDFDRHRGVFTTDNLGTSHDAVLLTVVHHFDAADSVRLRCGTIAYRGVAGIADVKNIRITAFKVGTLSNAPVGVGGTTWGSGSPVVRSVYHDDPMTVAVGAGLVDVGHILLTRGNWLVTAKATVNSPSISGFLAGTVADCHMVITKDFDETVVFGYLAGPASLGLVAVRHIEPDIKVPARLMCRASVGDAVVSDVKITAFKAGSLSVRKLGLAPVSYGSGTPDVRSGSLDSPPPVPDTGQFVTLGTLPLPAGAWAVSAKLVQTNGDQPTCRLVLGGDIDTVQIREPGSGYGRGSYLSGVHAFPTAGSATVQCKSDPGSGVVFPAFLKITAVLAEGLTNQAI